jgi:hypothetical protein
MLLLCSQAHQSILSAFLDVTVRVRLHLKCAVTQANGAELKLAASCRASKISRASADGLRHVFDEVVGREGFKLFPLGYDDAACAPDRQAEIEFVHSSASNPASALFLTTGSNTLTCASASRSALAIFNEGASRTHQYSAQTRDQKAPPFSLSAYQASQARAQRSEAL